MVGRGRSVLLLVALCAVVAHAGNRFADGSKPIKRSEILKRAQRWVNANVPYSQKRWVHEYLQDGGNKYRTDCSGFVSMAWKLDTSYSTVSLERGAPCTKITDKNELKLGDIFLKAGKHTMIFNGWVNEEKTRFNSLEEHGSKTGTIAMERKVDRSYIMCRYTRVIEDSVSALSMPTDADAKGDGDPDAENAGQETVGARIGSVWDRVTAGAKSLARKTNSILFDNNYGADDNPCKNTIKGQCGDAEACFRKKDKGFKIVREKCGGPVERICCTNKPLPSGVTAESDLSFVNGGKVSPQDAGFFDNLWTAATGKAGKVPEGFLVKAGDYPVENLDRRGRGTRMPKFRTPVNKFLLHTIEGRWPKPGDYDGGTRTLDKKRAWPHFIIGYNRQGQLKIGQYLPLSIGGRALGANNAYGPIQVEIGVKANKPFTEHDAKITRAVAHLWAALNAATKGAIPISVDPAVKFLGSRKAYGKQAQTRLTRRKFAEVKGLVGHQHAPANSHWDPGAIDVSKLIKLATNLSNPVQMGDGSRTHSGQPTAPRAPRTARGARSTSSRGRNPKKPKKSPRKPKKPRSRKAPKKSTPRRTPVRKRSPVRKRKPSPVRKRKPSPVRKRKPSPTRKRTPVRKRKPSPTRKRTPVRKRKPNKRKPTKGRKPKKCTKALAKKRKCRLPKRRNKGTPLSPRKKPAKRGGP